LADEAIGPASQELGLQIIGTGVTSNGKIYITAVVTEGTISPADHHDLFVLHGAVKSGVSAGATTVSTSDIKIAEDDTSRTILK